MAMFAGHHRVRAPCRAGAGARGGAAAQQRVHSVLQHSQAHTHQPPVHKAAAPLTSVLQQCAHHSDSSSPLALPRPPTPLSLVVAAANLLGVSVTQALEAYGTYFVKHVQDNVSLGEAGR